MLLRLAKKEAEQAAKVGCQKSYGEFGDLKGERSRDVTSGSCQLEAEMASPKKARHGLLQIALDDLRFTVTFNLRPRH